MILLSYTKKRGEIMSLNDYVTVAMPERKITINSSNKNRTRYVYYTKRAYRNSKNQPTSEKILIGKRNPESGMLIPNKNYFDIFGQDMILYTKSILDFGNFFAINSVLGELGVSNILKKIFKKDYEKIISIAAYMLCEGNVLFYCDDWCSETFTHLDCPITSQSSSRLFEDISYENRMRFFREWSKLRSASEYIAYDVTSFSSYSAGNEYLEWGYNRDSEKLPQINLGMYFGETSRLPIYYCVYPGSILDKTHLQYMMQDNEILGIEKVKFVMDKGFYSLSNVRFMQEKGYPFILCVSNSLTASKKILEKYRTILTSSRYYSKVHDVYATSKNTDKYGVDANLHIFYDPTKAMLEENELYQKINILENRLSQTKKIPSKTARKKYEKYFDITENDGSISYKHNYEKIDNEKAYNGFFLLLTTDTEKNPNEILEIYKRKDLVEKSFDNLKNHMDMKRIRCHNKSTTEGKIFVAFIGLIIKSHMENILSEYMDTNNSTIEKVIRELKKIKVVTLQNGKRLMNPLTKKQKEILTFFKITEIDIKDYLASERQT